VRSRARSAVRFFFVGSRSLLALAPSSTDTFTLFAGAVRGSVRGATARGRLAQQIQLPSACARKARGRETRGPCESPMCTL
jgi:hypothetical protein